MRVEVIVWGIPAAASSTASSSDAAAAAAVAADSSAFLASICSSQSCSLASAAAAAGEVSPFLGGEAFGAGGRGEEAHSYLGAAGPAEAGARSLDRPPCPGAGPPCFTVSSHVSSGDPEANRAERVALASIELW